MFFGGKSEILYINQSAGGSVVVTACMVNQL